jgi:predicted lysophospholipase L1 biosynthesis ABC-type transport system permease subunit
MFAAAVYAAFFVALFTMKLYGGSAHDENGHQPLRLRVANRPRLMDLNVTVFSGFSFMLLVTMLLLSRATLAD